MFPLPFDSMFERFLTAAFYALTALALSVPAVLLGQTAVTGEVRPDGSSVPARIVREVKPLSGNDPIVIRDEPTAVPRELMPEKTAKAESEAAAVDAEPAEGEKTKGKPRNFNFKPSLKANEILGSTLETRTDARTFTLTVPAPRGMILDRNGLPLAQTKIVYYAAINFPALKNASDSDILLYAHQRISEANRYASGDWALEDKVILSHFRNRRWLPLTFSNVLTDDQSELLRPHQTKGLLLHPVYMRSYPHGKFASHIIGYIGNRPPRRTGEIESGEGLWGAGVGGRRSGGFV